MTDVMNYLKRKNIFIKREVVKMKTILLGFIFWGIVVGIIIGAGALANILAEIITMKMIMKVVYIMLGVCFIYIFKR